MKFYDALMSLLIILIFAGLYAFSIFSVGLKQIHEKWPEYRCNPMIMPFAGQLGPDGTDAGQNFTSCIQSQMKGSLGDLMKPIHYATSLANSAGGGITTALDDVRKVFDYVKNMVQQIVEQIIGVFMGIIIQVLKIIVKLKDLGSKIMGTMAAVLFTVDGFIKLGENIWAGPVGDVIGFLCFHPYTPLRLKNGTLRRMCDIKVGDILEYDTKVIGTLQLQGSEDNPYYAIYSNVLKKHIFVTGSHYIQDPTTKNFIPVAEFSGAVKGRHHTEHMSCLITDTHRIPIGEYTFWDWEDDN